VRTAVARIIEAMIVRLDIRQDYKPIRWKNAGRVMAFVRKFACRMRIILNEMFSVFSSPDEKSPCLFHRSQHKLGRCGGQCQGVFAYESHDEGLVDLSFSGN
jgi:hypothetical protein